MLREDLFKSQLESACLYSNHLAVITWANTNNSQIQAENKFLFYRNGIWDLCKTNQTNRLIIIMYTVLANPPGFAREQEK